MNARFAAVLLVIACLGGAAHSPAHACAMFAFARDGEVFMGNNEDFIKPGYMWFVPGRDSGRRARYGRVNFGFEDRFAQGSMNTAGLCFDGAALPEVPYAPDPEKKNTDNLVSLIMDECATVAEALDNVARYNSRAFANAQIMFADATGDAAVITQLPDGTLSIVRKTGDHLLNTNNRLEYSGYRCERFMLADRLLTETEEPTVKAMAAVLDAIHQRGAATTVYANVYEPAKGLVHLYHMTDFSRPLTIDLAKELDKGAHRVEMASLFPGAAALDAVLKESPRDYDTRIPLTAAQRAAYAGHYAVAEPPLDVTIGVEGPGLYLQPKGQGKAMMYPESETVFRFEDKKHGQITFRKAADGTVEGFTLHQNSDLWVPRTE